MSLETCSDDAENRHRVGSWIVLGRIFLVGVPDDSRTVIPGIAWGEPVKIRKTPEIFFRALVRIVSEQFPAVKSFQIDWLTTLELLEGLEVCGAGRKALPVPLCWLESWSNLRRNWLEISFLNWDDCIFVSVTIPNHFIDKQWLGETLGMICAHTDWVCAWKHGNPPSERQESDKIHRQIMISLLKMRSPGVL